MAISNANPSVATFTRYRYVAVGAETSLSGADANGNVMSYSPGREQVYLNGTMLVRAQDYTATTGTSITGLTALTVNDVVEVLAFTSFAVAAGVAQDEAPSSPAEGQLWLDTNGSAPGVQFARWSKTMSAGVTSLTGTDDYSVTLAYTAGLESVYRNGVLLSRGVDYTATNGTSITLDDATLANDIIEIFAPTSVGFADVIPNSLVDAKGDLITASSNNVPARIAIGSNDQVLVADSNEPNGLAWKSVATPFAAGKNKIINGDFGIWQRGTSFAFTSTDNRYTADRFLIQCNVSSGTATVSQQTFTAGSAPVAGYEAQYYLRVATSAGTTNAEFQQRVEDARTFAGQTVTLSFWAKASSSIVMSNVIYQYFGSGGSATVTVNSTQGNQTLTTSWQRFILTFSMPSVSGKTIGTGSYLQIYPMYYGSGTIASNNIDIWGVQLEAGAVATPFTTATGTLAGELAACQRYYYLHASGATKPIALGSQYSNTQLQVNVKFPVTMRTDPTLSATSGTDYFAFARNVGSDSFNSFTLDIVNTNNAQIYNASEISGTAGQVGHAYTNNASASLAFSAEL